VFFDDLLILLTIDRSERERLTGALSSGQDLLREVLASPYPVHDDDTSKSFVRELELGQAAGRLNFTVMQTGGGVAPPSVQSMGASGYLAYMREFELTPFGHELASCRVYEREPPDPGEDDGKPITRLTLQRIVEIVAAAYDEPQLQAFLLDGGVPQEMIPPLGDDGGGLADLFSLFNDGDSASRRILRHFLGRWLDQELDSGPNADQERELREDLARQGWFTHEGRLLRREPIRRATMAPLIGGDLLSNLHPRIQEAARPSFSVGRRAEAVFEAFKTIELRVRELLASDRSGMSLMGDAFEGEQPPLTLNDGNNPTDIDEQRGFAFIFKGAMQGIRNPKAHAPFEELEERRALDYLGLASLLMRRLDDAEEHMPEN
jgi:uncharacterized protein (TIGR02391 family)